ncbi:hypothetical protein Suden_0054 [Sulfurimonas denitrificans DSM 1251]|jgi:PBP1b-binding outer membrane lipoprotein LpoB|uniref:Lipoprotein n=1 Tax=Sulfurimonas denitrificans (strain ATCC 33889 / DSM 1251) TaxID=326298 RepID=Q30UJ6_SULDN|nr:hypothetical protein [Sulfurimonas denitrificans]ABB43335.1 hypothetical protein Suden_0054 [Sulfurimonas denitrificans DSM 1251]MDD3442313.1 hypothetical protein [Sulfurimonas denitrificans]
MRRVVLLSVLVLSLFLSGCSSKDELKPKKKSYFYFSGKADNVEIRIDEGTKFDIVASKKSLYSIDEGAHVIEIFRKNQMILKYNFVFEADRVKEIELR